MTRTNVYQQTPLPIETAYFLNDAVKVNVEGGKKLMRDPNKFNRFYFDYPPEWKTSNTGEMIVGVRSMWTLNKRRIFPFLIFLRKYRKQKFYETAKKVYPDEYGEMNLAQFVCTYIDDDKIQTIIDKIIARTYNCKFSFLITVLWSALVKILKNFRLTSLYI